MTNEIETYYRAATVGALACICTHDDIMKRDTFRFMRIRDVKQGRIYTGYGAFWAKSGKKCDQRNGGSRYSLVVPSLDLVEQEATRKAPSSVWELEQAEAVLMGRQSEMPEPPPPPVPTVDEAEAELRAALAASETADVSSNNPGAYQRVVRNAARRVEAARANLERARKAAGAS